MYFEIVVSLNGKHLFATAEKSVVNTYQLHKIYDIFKEKFPREEGYKITVTTWEKVGRPMNMEEA